MDRSKHLILIKGEDKTADIKFCKYTPSTQRFDVTFQSGKTYPYNYNSIEWVKNPIMLDPANVRLAHKDRELLGIQSIYVFYANATAYWFVRFLDGREWKYDSRELRVVYSCLGEKVAKSCFDYLQELASVNELKSDDGEILLKKQYEGLGFIATDVVMAAYLYPQKYKLSTYYGSDYIFPFGINASQAKAVVAALTNQVSIIQGPPGTGKTQTILNIIANILVAGKTVQVVSNNNSAIQNVLEKLSSPQYGFDFIVAPLGKSDNKKEFIKNQTGHYPPIEVWELNANQLSVLKAKIGRNVQDLSNAFSYKERLAQARSELDAIDLEMKYFEQYCSETGLIYPEIKLRRHISTEKTMRLWNELREMLEKERDFSFWFKVKGTFLYGINEWSIYNHDLPTIITLVQRMFYRTKRMELTDEILELDEYLATMNTEEKMAELMEWSLDLLYAKLFERYDGKTERKRFSEDDLWQRGYIVAEEYPVVLSTTFSSRSSLKDVIYDYLIMDEASQVDVATGALALSCARNAIIVGDSKQLPNVVKDDIKSKCDAIFDTSGLPLGYSFTKNSFLESVRRVLPNVPQTLLKEHYRCHPKIIGFCNQKFYNNELIIMTEDRGEGDVLKVFRTVVGNHKRERTNQRQIEVMIQEALPLLDDINPDDIGIIAPYRDQVSALRQQLKSRQIDVDTVHKFQGRERDAVVLSTVDNEATDFSDNPNLLNVAISRAKKRLFLVVSGNEQPADSNIGDLISYIEYNNFDVVHSEIRSVFDLLYGQYTEARIEYLKKHSRVSEYDSENLMYAVITDTISLERYSKLSLNVIFQQSLNMLIRDFTRLNEEECQYVANPATHVDFLIYNRFNKKPIVAIEVDGFHYHKLGTEQYERDKMKYHILECYGIPLLRFPTNGSEECVRLEQFLDEYADV